MSTMDARGWLRPRELAPPTELAEAPTLAGWEDLRTAFGARLVDGRLPPLAGPPTADQLRTLDAYLAVFRANLAGSDFRDLIWSTENMRLCAQGALELLDQPNDRLLQDYLDTIRRVMVSLDYAVRGGVYNKFRPREAEVVTIEQLSSLTTRLSRSRNLVADQFSVCLLRNPAVQPLVVNASAV